MNAAVASRFRRVSGEAGWVVLGQGLAFLGNFALIKLLTSELGPAAYGQLSLGISIAGVLHMFLYGPMEQTALRFVSVYRETGRTRLLLVLLKQAHRYAAAIVLAVAAGLSVAAYVAAGPDWGLLMLCALCFGVAGGVNATLSSLQTALRQRRSAAIFQGADVWLRLGLALTALLLLPHGATTVLLGFCLGTLCIALAQGWALARNPAWRDQAGGTDDSREDAARSELLRYAMPYVGFAAFAWLGSYSDRWMVLAFADEHSVGIYAALLQIANAPIALFLGMTNQYLVPLIFDRAGAAQTAQQHASSARLLKLATAAYATGLAVMVAVAAAFGEPLVRLLTNAEFAQHASLLWVLCAGLGLASMGQLLVVKGLSRNSSREYMAAKVVQVVALLAAAPLLIQSLGLLGMGLALCASGSAYLLAVALTNRRYFGTPP